jgi:hypothetical protein
VKERSGQSLEQLLDRDIFRPSLVTQKSIQILSRNLLRLLQSVVQDYPGQSLRGDEITMLPHFEMLAHYYKDLIALKDRKPDILPQLSSESLHDEKQPDLPNPAGLLDQATIHDLNVLMKSFNGHYIKIFVPVEARYNLGIATFELLWFLFKPGVSVYARFSGKLAGFIFERYEKIPKPNAPPSSEFIWAMHCWNLTYNGRRIVRTSIEFHIDKFRAEKQITSLPVFPRIYLDSSDGGSTKARLQDLGEKYYTIIRKGSAHMQYSGQIWDLESLEANDVRRDKTGQKDQLWKPDSVCTAYPL